MNASEARAASILVACRAYMLQLEAKGTGGLVLQFLTEDERVDLGKLRAWWFELGPTGQDKLDRIVKGMVPLNCEGMEYLNVVLKS